MNGSGGQRSARRLGPPAGSGLPSLPVPDARADLRQAMESLAHEPAAGHGHGVTSDLTFDEELMLHSVGWAPVELVNGVSVYAVAPMVWSWGQGEIASPTEAANRSFVAAAERLGHQSTEAGGHGVVGVHVEWSIGRHQIGVALAGTAVRPVDHGGQPPAVPFVSDLSGRDFALLHAAGWAPVGLAAGTSFVFAPRRTVGTVMQQTGQNVELANYTEAMYTARASAMTRMQEAALALRGAGVVEVKVSEGPMAFANHAVGFTAYGTVVVPTGEHRHPDVHVVLPMDDAVRTFEATSLRH